MKTTLKKPPWLKIRLPAGEGFAEVRELIRSQDLHTVCHSARCPNVGECWDHRTATFMILGDVCTRNCTFCAVSGGNPDSVDATEPQRVAHSVKILGLKYAVITSVTRDDLPDGGAGVFAETVRAIRETSPDCKVELLIPDFQGDADALQSVIEAAPDVLGHNLETVPSLYPRVRPQADYQRSLGVLRRTAEAGVRAKTGLMLGLGEDRDEVQRVMRDVLGVGCRLMTFGQYLQPTRKHHPVVRYVHPDEFAEIAATGDELGFDHVEAGPLVRSSYRAHLQMNEVLR
jgi:lipoic acid synthetase